MVSVRKVLVFLALAFTAYLAIRGLWWTDPISYPLLIITVLALYLATAWLCLFLEQGWLSRRPPVETVRLAPLPAWACVLAVATAVLVPTLVSIGVGPESRTASFATWYIGGIGVLMTIVMVRRRPWVAWGGMLALAIGSALWIGLLPALSLGLLGSLVWVGGAQLQLISVDRASRDTARLAELQQAASAWQASQRVRQRERRVQVQRALSIAGPVLTRVIAEGGQLSDADRTEAHLAEGRLRDELRGPRLLDDDVRAALEAARRRGAAVTMLDEGGLDGLDEASLAVVRGELAATLRAAESERLYIRTSPHDRVAVTVVGRPAGGEGPADEDTVDLWREIPIPVPTQATEH